MVEKMIKMPITWPNIEGHIGAKDAHAEWQAIVDDYEHDPGNVFYAWLYLGHHPLFWETQIIRDGDTITTVLNWSNAWSRYRCLEHYMAADEDGGRADHGLTIRPVHWSDDDNTGEVELYAVTFEELVCDAAMAVHDTYGNDREHITDTTGRWYG